uniref:LRP2-binding protein n=2 Tax=Trichobilharzia regenti TaxID=157069 RepID=A0AA85KDG3_TRIRE|nr:unnamed protein product [Trichobilharzia regenti]
MELLNGLPKTIRRENIDLNSKTVKNLLEDGKIKSAKDLSREIVEENLELLLRKWFNEGDQQCAFYLGQIYFEQERYDEAWGYFYTGYHKYNDQNSKFQLGVMLYDNLVSRDITKIPDPQAKACELFREIMTLDDECGAYPYQQSLIYNAAYNLGRAYHQGYGVYPSVEDALRCFLFAANNGDPNACISAQTALGYLYSGPDIRDLEKAFQWHSDACGNGSVESQAALGVMYLYGIGVKENRESALYCLSEASARGSLYARANLIYFYYQRKMFTNACYLASRMVSSDDILPSSDCILTFQYRAMSMACFLYALCLKSGKGVEKNESLASELFRQSIEWDASLAARYSRLVTTGEL